MKLHWMTAAVLSSAIAVGCGDRNNQNSQNNRDDTGAPASAPADTSASRDREAVSPDRDTSALDRDDSRATSGTRARARTESVERDTRARTQAPDTRRESANEVDRTAPDSRDFNNNSASSRTNAAPTVSSRAAARELTVPAGTSLPLELMTALSSETAQVETPVRARLRNSVVVDGVTAIPAGTVFNGNVTDVADAGRVKGKARLAFRFTEAQINGVRERLRTNPISFEAEATKGEDATKIGAGAGIGAAIGGIIGGGSGAAKGAAIGGAAGTGAVLATRGKQVTLAEGADISATLADAVSVRATR